MKKKSEDVWELVEFLAMLATWPYTLNVYAPDPKTGKTSRPPGSKYGLSYEPKCSENRDGRKGCVYAGTLEGVIRKAKRLFEAQEKAAKMIAEAAQ